MGSIPSHRNTVLHIPRRKWAWLSKLGLLLGLFAAPSAMAQIPLIHLSCLLGHETFTYTPGLTFTAALDTAVASNATFGLCTSTVGSTIDSGTATLQGLGKLSCLGGTATGLQTIRWNTGSTSTFQYSATSTLIGLNNIIVMSGTIITGEFAGATAIETVTVQSMGLSSCLGLGGLTQVGGAVSLQIISL
ncbi:hypothetical protein LZ198_36070 [Myxococcus sp. K15C18031901]|uniref:hypothetical protein n=1 Tax=Myxococcus dinghuensis TaxID=2906761 RepID=UPI0020A78B84|nr:hypothetical protein [Myxococcus dinghuensis]MCP3104295.1 hypothetical protein [Myxococcus dinghuensis]